MRQSPQLHRIPTPLQLSCRHSHQQKTTSNRRSPQQKMTVVEASKHPDTKNGSLRLKFASQKVLIAPQISPQIRNSKSANRSTTITSNLQLNTADGSTNFTRNLRLEGAIRSTNFNVLSRAHQLRTHPALGTQNAHAQPARRGPLACRNRTDRLGPAS